MPRGLQNRCVERSFTDEFDSHLPPPEKNSNEFSDGLIAITFIILTHYISFFTGLAVNVDSVLGYVLQSLSLTEAFCYHTGVSLHLCYLLTVKVFEES